MFSTSSLSSSSSSSSSSSVHAVPKRKHKTAKMRQLDKRLCVRAVAEDCFHRFGEELSHYFLEFLDTGEMFSLGRTSREWNERVSNCFFFQDILQRGGKAQIKGYSLARSVALHILGEHVPTMMAKAAKIFEYGTRTQKKAIECQFLLARVLPLLGGAIPERYIQAELFRMRISIRFPLPPTHPLYQIPMDIFQKLDVIANHPLASATQKLEASHYKARLLYTGQLLYTVDHVSSAINSFLRVAESSSPSRLKGDAMYYLGQIRLFNETDRLTHDQGFEWLEKCKPLVSSKKYAKTIFMQAKYRIKQLVGDDRLTYAGAFQYLTEALKTPCVSGNPPMRADVQITRALLRCLGQVDDRYMTDDQAEIQLGSVALGPGATDSVRAMARYWWARLRCEERGVLMSYQEAHDILFNEASNPFLRADCCWISQFCALELRFHNKAVGTPMHRLFEGYCELFMNNALLPEEIKNLAIFRIVELRLDGRIGDELLTLPRASEFMILTAEQVPSYAKRATLYQIRIRRKSPQLDLGLSHHQAYLRLEEILQTSGLDSSVAVGIRVEQLIMRMYHLVGDECMELPAAKQLLQEYLQHPDADFSTREEIRQCLDSA